MLGNAERILVAWYNRGIDLMNGGRLE